MNPRRRRCRAASGRPVDLERTRRLRRIIDEHKATYGLDYATDAFGMVACLPADHLTGDQRWMLDQISADYRASCAAVWAEYGGPS